MAKRAPAQTPTKLKDALVLNRFVLSLFGVTSLEALSENLKDLALEGYDANNVSHFHHTLLARLYANPALPAATLLGYDQNIYAHTRRISESRAEPIRWKYFQYLTLLFTEIYLDRYFASPETLRDDLNAFLEKEKAEGNHHFYFVAPYETKDLRKLAFWNATGSGKTLLLHVNLLQYQHYLRLHQRTKELNRVIVLTPNEGLSRQHLAEFRESGLEAELFDKSGGGLFTGQKIELIDIGKFRETSGQKTVAIDAFEGNNLVLIDEGHRGSSGDVWKVYRDKLSADGFAFEYSATFGQAVSAAFTADRKKLLGEYGKATLFDYSYRYFYRDGYGKDYQILNINDTWKPEMVELYLTAYLLSFHEQLAIYREYRAQLGAFLIEKPLAIFVGSKVTAVRTEEGQSVSDVVQILEFLHRFVHNPTASVRHIDLLLDCRDGLVDGKGTAIFQNAFPFVKSQKRSARQVYDDLLREVFNSQVPGASLHLENLKGQDGEIGLRVGQAEYFGVINVGDDAKLLKLCEDQGLFTGEREFATSQFAGINRPESSINLLIGSKKFTEGWSSWRVSAMGLMNIGRGEGSEIIQLFGRGVRLKGYGFGLKRSRELDLSVRPAWLVKPLREYLGTLETLSIFGIRADYMAQFKEYLAEEGLPTETQFEEIRIEILPAVRNLPEKKLKIVRVREGANFKTHTVTLRHQPGLPVVKLDWYPKVQLLKSANTTALGTSAVEEGKLAAQHLAFFDWNRVFFDLEGFKAERGWNNLSLNREVLPELLSADDWYKLLIPNADLDAVDFRRVARWQEIGTTLLKGYCERLYNHEKARFYSQHLETALLDETHPNFEKEYLIRVEEGQTQFIQKLHDLKDELRAKQFADKKIGAEFGSLHLAPHLYTPLLYLDGKDNKDKVKIQPVALNKGEATLVEDIRRYLATAPPELADAEVFLLRNVSRKGIGFFEANNFYPDFILWITRPDRQHVAFIDPKGIRNLAGLDDPKIAFHQTIKGIEQRLGDAGLVLHSFIVSNTPFADLKHWKGQETMQDFNRHHVYFQQEQRGPNHNYVEMLVQQMRVA